MGRSVVTALLFLFTVSVAAQERPPTDPNIEFATVPLEFEKQTAYQRTAILRLPPFGDSVYAEAVQDELHQLLTQDGRWNVIAPKRVEDTYKRDMIGLETETYTPQQLKSWAQEWNVDTLWVASAQKVNTQIRVNLRLWNRHLQQNWLTWEELAESGKDLDSTRKTTQRVFKTLMGQIPFDGEVLSRNQQNITLNIGTKAGLKNGQSVVISRIRGIQRHPTDRSMKTIYLQEIGRVKIKKAENDLSFAEVTQESPENPVLTQHKVVITQDVMQDATISKRGAPSESPLETVAFGTNAEAWAPRPKPSLGFASLSLGLGTLRLSDTPTTGTAKSLDPNFVPTVRLDAELWISRVFFVNTFLAQSIASLEESSGGSPVNLNSGATSLGIFPGARYLIEHSNVYGPQIRVMMGYSRYAFYIDSTNDVTTSKTYDGFTLAADVAIPIDNYGLGLGFFRTFFTGLSEAPLTSSDTSSSLAWGFFLNGYYQWDPRWRIVGAVRLEVYNTSFSGSGGTRTTPSLSTSISTVSFQSGVSYYF